MYFRAKKLAVGLTQRLFFLVVLHHFFPAENTARLRPFLVACKYPLPARNNSFQGVTVS